MNKETREQIEKDADYFIKSKLSENTPTTGQYHWTSYVAGATAQHPKAWNNAIGEALSETWKLFDTSDDENKPIIHQVTKILESLKLDPNQA